MKTLALIFILTLLAVPASAADYTGSEDGKTLTIDRVDTGRQGPRESKMVFVRP